MLVGAIELAMGNSVTHARLRTGRSDQQSDDGLITDLYQ
jgi:hypothetical protein